jgi:alginate O-acetyltransferase complex protein AlgI
VYCDFAGYSYIAIGVSMLFGIRLQQNFLSPFLSQSIREFWMRWHISLTAWFREYFYVSLPSSRKSKFRGRINVLFTFAVSGLWHGANWARVMWGLLSGITYFIPPAFPQPSKIGRVVNTSITLTLAVMALTFFRVQRISDAFAVFRRIGTSFWPVAGERGVLEIVDLYWWRIAMIVVVMAFEVVQRNAPDLPRIYKWPAPARYAFYAFMALAYFYRGNFERIPFIYFQY